jgi:hypothetical protein
MGNDYWITFSYFFGELASWHMIKMYSI